MTRRPSKPFPRRARSCLFWAIASFLVAQAGFLLAKDTAKPEWRDPEYAHKLQRLRERIKEFPGRPLVIVMGSSRIGFGLRTDAMQSNQKGGPGEPMVFNFGMCRCSPVLQRLMLERLLADGVRPAAILVEWYAPFMRAGSEQADVFMNPVRLSWSDLQTLQRFSDKPKKLRERWFEAQWSLVYSHRHTMLNRYAISWVPTKDRFDDQWAGMGRWGWTPNRNLAKRMPEQFFNEHVRNRTSDFASLYNEWKPSRASDQAYRETLRMCREAKIPAALLWAPEPSWARKWDTPDALARMEVYLQELQNEFAAALVNARDWLPDELFLEEMHPLHSGAEVFAMRFEHELLPRLRQIRLTNGHHQ